MGGTRMTLDRAIRFATHLKVWVGDRESTRDPGRESDANGTRIGARGQSKLRTLDGNQARHCAATPVAAARNVEQLVSLSSREQPIGCPTPSRPASLLDVSARFAGARSIQGDRLGAERVQPNVLPRTWEAHR